MFLATQLFYSQSTISGFGNGGHQAGASTNDYYVGWNNNPIDLDFKISNRTKMQLARSENITVAGFAVDHFGFLGLSTDQDFFDKGAVSMIHLDGGNAGSQSSEGGFRTWMKYGMSISANRDRSYFGIKDNLGLDQTETVIAWSNNAWPGNVGPDNLVFKFVSSYQQNASFPEQTQDGREVARFAPNGMVGIGDFSNNGFGVNEQPTQVLDVIGTARLRNMPNNNPDVLITGVGQDASNDHVLNYLAFSGEDDEFLNGDGDWVNINATGDDCKWEYSNFGIFTGAPNSSCNTQNVGIGSDAQGNSKVFIHYLNPPVSGPKGISMRMDVLDDDPFQAYGIFCDFDGGLSTAERAGIKIHSSGGQESFGGYFRSIGSPNAASFNSVGVYGSARGAKFHNIGVYGIATRDNCITNPLVIGVYGEAFNDEDCFENFDHAGYFVGSIVDTGGHISVSDKKFKKDVKELDSAIEIIDDLQPKQYNFRTDEYHMMKLSNKKQFGLIAQELEEVLPNLVYDTKFPAKYDEEGEMTSESFEFKGVNYEMLIPILIQGTKEQQAMIEELQTQISDLQESLNEVVPNEGFQNNNGANDRFELYQNSPNPFSESTEIVWRMGVESKAQIIVQDLDGKIIETLYDANCSKGLHSIEWHANGLASGNYFYSLIVNGELHIKRAIVVK